MSKVLAPLDLGGNGITSVATPVNPSDAATKSYADSVAGASTFISAPIGNGSATTLTVTHNLNITTPVVQAWDVSGSNPVQILVDATATDANTVSLTFSPAPASGSVKAVVMAPGTGTGGGSAGIALAGDLGGSPSDPQVESIQGTPISPPPGGTAKYLRGDGTWDIPPGSASVSITDFGATTSAPDNGPAIASAIASLPASGGTIMIPPGTFTFSTPLNLAGLRSITLTGQANPGGGASMTSTLLYTGTGPASAISLQNSNAIVLRNLAIMYSSASMTGILTDWRNVTGSDTSYGLLDNCYLGGSPSTVTTAQSLVNLDKCINMTVRKCNFAGATYAIYGKSSAGNYSNAVQVENCVFHGQATAHIYNAGQAWTVTGCTFEALAGGTAGAYAHDSGNNADGLMFTGCWTGDSTGGTQFTVSGKSVVFLGNWIGATAGTCINTDDVVTGLIIIGCDFEGASVGLQTLPGGSTSATGWVILGNTYTSVTSNLSGNFTAGCLWHNGSFTLNAYGLNVNGLLTLVDGNNVTVGSANGSKIGTSTAQKLSFWNAAPIAQPTVSGASLTPAVSSLLTALANMGLISNTAGAPAIAASDLPAVLAWEAAHALGTTGSTATLDATAGAVHTATLGANTAFSFASGLAAGAWSITLILSQPATGGPWTPSWTGVKWPDGLPPALTMNPAAEDALVFTTVNGGTTWIGNLAGLNYS